MSLSYSKLHDFQISWEFKWDVIIHVPNKLYGFELREKSTKIRWAIIEVNGVWNEKRVLFVKFKYGRYLISVQNAGMYMIVQYPDYKYNNASIKKKPTIQTRF